MSIVQCFMRAQSSDELSRPCQIQRADDTVARAVRLGNGSCNLVASDDSHVAEDTICHTCAHASSQLSLSKGPRPTLFRDLWKPCTRGVLGGVLAVLGGECCAMPQAQERSPGALSCGGSGERNPECTSWQGLTLCSPSHRLGPSAHEES